MVVSEEDSKARLPRFQPSCNLGAVHPQESDLTSLVSLSDFRFVKQVEK